ncbi:MAG: tyrosine-type recombinase/integrase [Dysgonamonadaceae bacterium]|jgi:integrase|nr:tyrosine-type recombinase/integrase [Dysgonamonadaceae bacterium]
MRKLKQTLVDLNYSKGNIVIQCNYNGLVYRYNAFKVHEKYFDKRTKSLKPCDGLFDIDVETKRIQDLFVKVNTAIVHILPTLSKKETIKKEVIDEYIKNYIDVEIAVPQTKNLIEDFEIWIEEYKRKKQQEDNLKGNDRKLHPSAKDYISCKNLLKDYEHDNCEDKPLVIDDMNNDFLCNLMEYAYEPRPASDGDYKYLTEGELVNKTLQKRFDSLFAFLKNKYGEAVIQDLKKPQLEFIISEIVRLDINELSQLMQTPIKEPHLIKVREYFLFLCHTGLRYGDFARLDKTFYDTKDNKLKLEAQKTFGACEIYLVDVAKEIAKKYNFEFRDYTNQALNRAIKEMFEQYDLFSEPHTKTYYQKGRKTLTAPKRDFISTHTGRKTFISLLFEDGFDIFAVMGMTGHKRIDTLRYYADKFGKKRDDKMKGLNNKLIKIYKNEK